MDMELDTEDLLEDVDVDFDKSDIKLLMEFVRIHNTNQYTDVADCKCRVRIRII